MEENKKLSIAVLSANLRSHRNLVRLLQTNERVEKVSSFKKGRPGLQHLRQQKVDLIFIDPELPDISGFDLINFLDEPPLTVLVSNRYDYGYFAFQIDAVDFLMPPVDFKELNRCLDKALLEFNRRKVYEIWKLETGSEKAK